ncbi:sce7726 family protein [Shewanella xiamenensis]|uniref:sce7726 family protein n=1 Tax=Shewanella xiamenensis TaxID=332186 RepID=UPI0035B8BDB1
MYDKDIRQALKQFLLGRKPAPLKIIDELKVNNGLARADLVAAYKTLHCFEIKSDKDTVARLGNQIDNYDLCFEKVTLVTTEKLLSSAKDILPEHWGIMLAIKQNDNVCFRYQRKATRNPNFSADIALLSLWKDELIEMDSILGASPLPKKARREFIANKISNESSRDSVSQALSQALSLRSKFTERSM